MDVASLAVAAEGGPGSRDSLARGEGWQRRQFGEPAERWRFAEIQTVERRIAGRHRAPQRRGAPAADQPMWPASLTSSRAGTSWRP
eukprot:608607-Pyramimonas_sp.AAC.1